MIAFWKYDTYPYCLSGTVGRENGDGTVYVPDFLGNFRPIAVLPNPQGQKVKGALEQLEGEYREAAAALLAEYKAKAKQVDHERRAEMPESKHYPEEWGPSDNRRLTCSCGNPDPGHTGHNVD